MLRTTLLLLALGCSISSVVMAEEQQTKPLDGDLVAVQGLWEGAWGGGQLDGVVFQPVIAKLAVHGNRAQWWGLPQTGDDHGTISLSKDAKGKTLRLTSAAKPDDAAQGDVASFSYLVNGTKLTLAVGEGRECSLARIAVASPPLANVAVEFVTAEQIDKSGNLRITRLQSRRVASLKVEYFEPQSLNYSTKDASVFRIEKRELKQITIDQARQLLNKPTPIVLTFRNDTSPPDQPGQDPIAAQPDSEPSHAMLKSLLGDGTLVFVLPPERVPAP